MIKHDKLIWSPELYHHGVLGMHWGIRRYQPYPKGSKKGKEVGEAAKAPKHDTTIDDYIKTHKVNKEQKKYLEDLQVVNDFLHDDLFIKQIVSEMSKNRRDYTSDFRKKAKIYLQSDEPAIKRYYKKNRSFTDEVIIEDAFTEYEHRTNSNFDYDRFVNSPNQVKLRDSLNLGPAEKLRLMTFY